MSVTSENRTASTPPAASAKSSVVWLDVPYPENESAKRLGARFSRRRKRWYVPRSLEPEPFGRWFPGAEPETDAVAAFAAFLQAHGARLDGPPAMDGHWRRVAAGGDTGSKRSASYRGFLDGRPNGQLVNFKTGERTDWRGRTKALGAETRAASLEDAARRRAEREAERAARHEATARRAGRLWSKATPLPAGETALTCHPYLAVKRVGAYGVRLSPAGQLLVPVRDLEGRLWSLLLIDADGQKRFLKGGRKNGLMHLIDPNGAIDHGPVLIAEGYATAATVHEATGWPAVTAFDAGNLESVALAIRERHLTVAMVVAGDDDHGLDPHRQHRARARRARRRGGGRRGGLPSVHRSPPRGGPHRLERSDARRGTGSGTRGVTPRGLESGRRQHVAKRDRLISVWVTPDEKAEVVALARRARVTVSELGRRLVLGRALPDPSRQEAVLALLRVNADQARLGNLLRLALADEDFEAPGNMNLETLFDEIRTTQYAVKVKLEEIDR